MRNRAGRGLTPDACPAEAGLGQGLAAVERGEERLRDPRTLGKVDQGDAGQRQERGHASIRDLGLAFRIWGVGFGGSLICGPRLTSWGSGLRVPQGAESGVLTPETHALSVEGVGRGRLETHACLGLGVQSLGSRLRAFRAWGVGVPVTPVRLAFRVGRGGREGTLAQPDTSRCLR